MEMLGKEPSAGNSPEKPKRSAEDRDRVSLLPGRGSKWCLSHEGAGLGRNSAFSTAAGRRGCLDAGAVEPRGTHQGPGHPKSVPRTSCTQL